MNRRLRQRVDEERRKRTARRKSERENEGVEIYTMWLCASIAFYYFRTGIVE